MAGCTIRVGMGSVRRGASPVGLDDRGFDSEGIRQSRWLSPTIEYVNIGI